MSERLAGLLHHIVRHEYFDKTHTRVVVRVLGWESGGFSPDPDYKEIAVLVPNEDLPKWTLGKSLRVNYDAI